MYHLMAPRYPFAVFINLEEALSFLSPSRNVDLGAELDAMRQQIFGAPPFLLRLRAALDAAKVIPSVAELSRIFGMSPRTFQRRLADHQTGYHMELQCWRISRAEHLLATSVLSMTEIAKRLGFAAASSFVAAFRAARGVTPEAWRKQRRIPPP
jgi:AraC-like DNA-binding protein